MNVWRTSLDPNRPNQIQPLRLCQAPWKPPAACKNMQKLLDDMPHSSTSGDKQRRQQSYSMLNKVQCHHEQGAPPCSSADIHVLLHLNEKHTADLEQCQLPPGWGGLKGHEGQTCQKPATTTTSLAWHFALEIPRILTGQGHLGLRITVRRKQVTASSGAIDSTTFLDCYRCICYVCMWHVGENPLMSLMHNGRLGACHTDLASNRRARQWPAPVCLQQEALCGLLLLQLLKLTCLNLKLDSGKDSCWEPRLPGGD